MLGNAALSTAGTSWAQVLRAAGPSITALPLQQLRRWLHILETTPSPEPYLQTEGLIPATHTTGVRRSSASAAPCLEPQPVISQHSSPQVLSLGGISSSNGPATTGQPRILTSEMQAAAAGGFSTGVTTMPSGQGFKKTFYKRHLPSPPSIAFASQEGRLLFSEALAAGHMSGFFKLMEQFSTQDEPSFCGLASLAMVLNALAIDPRRTWKGSWRWFHEQMLDCCRPLEDVKREGITLPQAACLARCNGARVTLHTYGSFTMDDLRQQILAACSSGEHHLVVSYSRKTLLQTGDGHFSPVGGYHAGKDLVLILDVARFKYPPHWVPLHLLYDAMKHVDKVTGRPRGFLRMEAQPLLDSVLLTLDVRSSVWQLASSWLQRDAPAVIHSTAQQAQGEDVRALVQQLLATLPLYSLDSFLMLRQNVLPPTGGNSNGGTPPSGSAIPPRRVGTDSSTAQLLRAAAVAVGAGATSPETPGPQASSRKPRASHTCEVPEKCLPVAAREQLLSELRALPLFSVVQACMQRSGQLDACTALPCNQGSLTGDGTAPGTRQGSPPSEPHVPGAPPALPPVPHHHHNAEHAQGCCGSNHPADSTARGSCEPGLPGPGAQGEAETAGFTCATELTPAPDSHLPLGQRHGNSGYLAEKATMFLLLMRASGLDPPISEWVDQEAGMAWGALLDSSVMSIVSTELRFLCEQWAHVDEVVQSGSLEPTCNTGCTAKLDCVVLKC